MVARLNQHLLKMKNQNISLSITRNRQPTLKKDDGGSLSMTRTS
jgi:hypothetical protein